MNPSRWAVVAKMGSRDHFRASGTEALGQLQRLYT